MSEDLKCKNCGKCAGAHPEDDVSPAVVPPIVTATTTSNNSSIVALHNSSPPTLTLMEFNVGSNSSALAVYVLND
jgi:hypothetical protein